MLKVVEVNYIRHQGNKKDRSYAHIAKQVNRDPRTVKKYIEKEDWNPEEIKQQRPSPVMDPVKPIINQWLKEDLKKNKKFRRTARRIYQLLVNGYEFKGSYRSIRRYVSKEKQELLEDKKAVLPLTARPGTAQVDFGEAPFKCQGKTVKLPFLVLSFPFSNAFYFQVFQSENKECFLEGMKRIFHHIGGVPKAIRFDNLSSAVKKVLPDGERELTEEFHRFALHYNFEYEFCNPASGQEKGHVEAMVKYVRNNFLLPEIAFHDLDDLNRKLWRQAEDDRARDHYQKKKPICELFEEDQQEFLVLPTKEFQVVRYVRVRADKYGMVRVDLNKYSPSPRFAKCIVLAKLSYGQIELVTEEYEPIVTHERLYGHEGESMKWPSYLTLMAKRPKALKYTRFYDQLPVEWKDYLANCTLAEKKETLHLLAILLKEHNFTYATEALKGASIHGHPSPDAIKQMYYQVIHGRGETTKLSIPKSLPSMPDITRDLNRYDRLQKVVD